MSTYAYGRIVKRRGGLSPDTLQTADAAAGQDENKLISALAAIVPVEIIAGHAIVLAACTTKAADGTVTIKPDSSFALMWSLPILMAVAVLVYLIGRGRSNWKGVDVIRLLIPPIAFLVWTALIGTSALTPWLLELKKSLPDINDAVLVVAAVAIGIILAAISAKVAPPKT